MTSSLSLRLQRLPVALAILAALAAAADAPFSVRAVRSPQSPIVREDMLPGDEGASINGPSLIRVPAWVKQPLGKYYLYFAHHQGKFIRFAHADRIEGPWKMLEGSVQRLDAQTALTGHIASPEAVVDEAHRQIFLFYHGNPSTRKSPADAAGESGQVSSVSVSSDGIHFEPLNMIVGGPYLRVFTHGGEWFALNHTGILLRAERLGRPFAPVAKIIGQDISDAVDPARRGEPGATPVDQRPTVGPYRYMIRHVGVDVDGDRLTVFFSFVSHRPERILCTTVEMKGPPETWKAQGAYEVLRPETEAEGARLPLAYSLGGISRTRVHELRDPGVCRDGGDAWLIYSIAGEHGLGLARLSYEGRR